MLLKYILQEGFGQQFKSIDRLSDTAFEAKTLAEFEAVLAKVKAVAEGDVNTDI